LLIHSNKFCNLAKTKAGRLYSLPISLIENQIFDVDKKNNIYYNKIEQGAIR